MSGEFVYGRYITKNVSSPNFMRCSENLCLPVCQWSLARRKHRFPSGSRDWLQQILCGRLPINRIHDNRFITRIACISLYIKRSKIIKRSDSFDWHKFCLWFFFFNLVVDFKRVFYAKVLNLREGRLVIYIYTYKRYYQYYK